MNDSQQLSITRRLAGQNGAVVVLNLNGYIDSTTAPVLKNTLQTLEQKSNKFVLDFKNVEYVSSAGWGAILARIRTCRERNGDIVFASMMKEVYSIYELLELNKVIHYFPSIDEGLTHFGVSKEMTAETTMSAKATPAKEKKPMPPCLTIDEAIRAIVSEQPLLSSSGIRTSLKRLHRGFKKLSVFKVYRTLRRLGLNTREKRLYFAWQQAKKARGN